MKILVKLTILFSSALLSSCDSKTDFVKGDCVQEPDSMVVYKYEGRTAKGHKLSQTSNPSLPPKKVEDNLGSYIKSVCRN